MDGITKLVSEPIEKLPEAVSVGRVVIPLEEVSEKSEETPELVKDQAELEIVVIDATVLEISLVELVLGLDVTELEVEFVNTIDELVIVLDSAVTEASVDVELDVVVPELDIVGLELIAEDTRAGVNNEDKEDVDSSSADRLEDVADDEVGLDSADDMLDSVVRLARRLDAEADDELGTAVDTPTLSALIMSAACSTVLADMILLSYH